MKTLSLGVEPGLRPLGHVAKRRGRWAAICENPPFHSPSYPSPSPSPPQIKANIHIFF